MIDLIFGIVFALVGIWLGLIIHSINSRHLRWCQRLPDNWLPPILFERHTDWNFWPLTRIPRRWTAWFGMWPTRILGNVDSWTVAHHPDITPPGTWILAWPFYFALTTRSGWHFRLPGLRWDMNGAYYNLTFGTLKRLR